MPHPRLRERRFRLRHAAIIIVALGALVWFGNDALIHLETNAASESKGTPADGSLQGGKRLPSSGPNFETYSRLGSFIGRTSVHDRVRTTMLDSYASLYREHPELSFVYGETGWPWGGAFWPHRTHQNGMSVDFMVPVRRDGEPDTLPTTFIDGFGYGLEFDSDGKLGDYEIDFEAMTMHLAALSGATDENGLRITRVIFAPELQKKLRATKTGRRLHRALPFSTSGAWVRHDDHYHVNFAQK